MPKENSSAQELKLQLTAAQTAIKAALALLSDAEASVRTAKRAPSKASCTPAKSLDFQMPLRAFVKRHCEGLNGEKKFILLLAYLAKGDETQSVPLAEIESAWNKMTSKDLLGMKFNRLYSSAARENDWAKSEARGVYQLRPSWKAIFDA